jgi:hypothetical protein
LTHIFVVALVRKDAGPTIEESVEALLAPYDQQVQGPEHEEACYCVGWKARRRASRFAEKQCGTIESSEALELAAKIFDSDAEKSSPDSHCQSCSGTGKYKTTYNPDGHWDWWRIGGRWDGVIQDKPRVEDWYHVGPENGKLENNFSTPWFLLGHHIIPAAIVTPDGDWHEEDWKKWEGRKKWEDRARSILSKNLETWAVGLDCHG